MDKFDDIEADVLAAPVAGDNGETQSNAMVIRTLISKVLVPLRPTDTVEHALGLLLEMRVRHMPVVSQGGMLVGLVSEDTLLDAPGPSTLLETLLGPEPISARPNLHVFEATKIIVNHSLTALPIAEEDGTYVGVVRRHDIFDQFAEMLSTQATGAILALEVDSREDYSVSQLAYSIEQSDVKILSIATESPEGEGPVRITVKLDTQDTARIRHMLEHHGYRVVAAFSETEDDEDLRYRVEEFMKYLEV